MAAPFDFANLAPYQQIAAQQLLDQSRRDPLQEMIKAAQAGRDFRDAPRIAQQKALQDQLTLDIQRANLQALQRSADPNDPRNKLDLAIAQANLAKLQQDPNIAFQRSLQEDAFKGILAGRNPNLIIQPTVDPAILAARAEAEAAGGVPSAAYEQSDFIPLIPASRGIPAMGTSESAGRAAAAREIAKLNARAQANGVPLEYFTDMSGEVQSRPKRSFAGAPGASGGATPLLDAEGNPVKERPKAGGSEEKAKAKLTNDLARSVQSNKAYQAYREVTESLHGLEATLEYSKSNPQDQTGVKSSAVDAFNKIINPNSIVRQQAFAQTTTGSSLVNRAEILFNSFINSQSITSAQIQAMLDLAKKYQEGSKQTVQRELATIKRRGDKGGIDPEDYLPDIFNEGSQAPIVLKTWEEGAALEPDTPYIGPDGKPYTRGAKK